MLRVQGAGRIEQGYRPGLEALLKEQVSRLASSPVIMLMYQVASLAPEPDFCLRLIQQRLYCVLGQKWQTQAF